MFGLDECLLRYLHTVFEGIEKVYIICILSQNDKKKKKKGDYWHIRLCSLRFTYSFVLFIRI